MRKHPFHLVDASPWPATGAVGSLFLMTGILSMIQRGEWILFASGLTLLILTSGQWFRDVRREATFIGKHTTKVESGMRLGMILFITSEVFFFFAFFWAFFHSSLRPRTELGSAWPPSGLVIINPFEVPILNTTVLLSSGATITWTHISVLNNWWMESQIGFFVTLILGLFFTTLQIVEYKLCSFTLSDSVYGSTFYLATGFHGLHVIIGTIFISVMILRHHCMHFSRLRHFGFEARAWYWHFVDVVWLFLFLCIYCWGY